MGNAAGETPTAAVETTALPKRSLSWGETKYHQPGLVIRPKGG
jgi:hypothetical protein